MLQQHARQAGLPVFQGCGLSESALRWCVSTFHIMTNPRASLPYCRMREFASTATARSVSAARRWRGYLGGAPAPRSRSPGPAISVRNRRRRFSLRARSRQEHVHHQHGTKHHARMGRKRAHRRAGDRPSHGQRRGETPCQGGTDGRQPDSERMGSIDQAIARAPTLASPTTRECAAGPRFPKRRHSPNGLLTANGRLRRADDRDQISLTHRLPYTIMQTATPTKFR